jgi:hypothetical protein
MRRRTFLQLAAAGPALAQSAQPPAGIAWTQWGGPHCNFQTEAAGLKDQWPAGGPNERNGLKTKATEVWASNRLRLHHGNAMRIGDTVYFSSGGKGSVAILTAVDVRSGKILWQDRCVPKATSVWADQKLITLDGNGNLMLAHPSPEGFKIVAKAELLTSLAWTPPALVGTRLYLRDRRNMMVVELG